MKAASFALALSLVLATFACGGTTTNNGTNHGVASVDGGTAPPDGTGGVCCPVSTGGCAQGGGYSADGTGCQSLCDGMCNQRIVAGEHGCATLAYEPCENGGGSAHADGGATCSYPPVLNDPRCPATYSYSMGGKSCAPLGLTCWYPGAGDGTPDGCFASAMLKCVGDGGAFDDAAADAGVGTWVGAQ